MLTATAMFVALALPAPMPAIHHGSCPGAEDAGGCYIAAQHAVYLHDNDRFARWHELGHAFDHTRLDPGERNRFRYLTGKRERPWLELLPEGTQGLSGPGDRYSRYSAAEEFADSYANCALGHGPGWRWETSTGYNPSRRVHRRVCRFILRAAKTPGNGAPAYESAAPPQRPNSRTSAAPAPRSG